MSSVSSSGNNNTSVSTADTATTTTAAAAAATTPVIPGPDKTSNTNDTDNNNNKNAAAGIKPPPPLVPHGDSDDDNADKSQLPVILCLHGGGSTATVFKIQARRLIWALSTQFRFIFANAPHQGAPGFGMLPVFASCAPFYRWVTRRWTLGAGDVEQAPADEVALVDDVLDELVARECGGDWGRVVGVMGFSQGARIVAGLLLRQLLLQKQKQKQKQNQQQQECKWKFKFGVMIGGPYCPISLIDQEEEEEEEERKVTVEDYYALLKNIPTVHAWGRDDHVRSGCEQLRAICDGEVCFQMDFEGGHHLPLKDEEARDLCDLIRAAWYQSGGAFEIGRGEKY